MNQKTKRVPALLLALVMVLSMVPNALLPTLAADDIVGIAAYSPVPGRATIYQAEDANGNLIENEYIYALRRRDIESGVFQTAEKHNGEFFVRASVQLGNVYNDLSGAGEAVGTALFCGGEDRNPATSNLSAVYVSSMRTFIAGPYMTTGGQEFYYMDAPAGNAQGAVGDYALQGYESGTLTDVTVLWDGTNVTVTPERLVPADKEPNTPVTGITLDKSTLDLAVGDSEQLTATIEPPAATNQNVVWTSSDPLVATVSDAGLVTAIAPGTATDRKSVV